MKPRLQNPSNKGGASSRPRSKQPYLKKDWIARVKSLPIIPQACRKTLTLKPSGSDLLSFLHRLQSTQNFRIRDISFKRSNLVWRDSTRKRKGTKLKILTTSLRSRPHQVTKMVNSSVLNILLSSLNNTIRIHNGQNFVLIPPILNLIVKIPSIFIPIL